MLRKYFPELIPKVSLHVYLYAFNTVLINICYQQDGGSAYAGIERTWANSRFFALHRLNVARPPTLLSLIVVFCQQVFDYIPMQVMAKE